jgi:hypothetical protein
MPTHISRTSPAGIHFTSQSLGQQWDAGPPGLAWDAGRPLESSAPLPDSVEPGCPVFIASRAPVECANWRSTSSGRWWTPGFLNRLRSSRVLYMNRNRKVDRGKGIETAT